jgi:hypothetical protein
MAPGLVYYTDNFDKDCEPVYNPELGLAMEALPPSVTSVADLWRVV